MAIVQFVFFRGMLRATFHRDCGFRIASSLLCILFRHDVLVEESQSLPIVLARVEVHLWLDLEHEIPLVSAKQPRPEIVFLSI